ncbi:VOC family protein [Sphingomonas quercus]|uniref:VOC family protein n=1 Tax=Sphingomonas quercus TaxID=2842451 RepID=A0ABS6BMX0_9SPHN|nr:VOC family protein [Sphingomonas quercus]MBU3078726.1 VOC family protein [Sphingomonas quercus]
MVQPIPDGYHTVTPYLIINGAAKALDWYVEAFGAEEVMRMPMGDKIAHAEMRIGDSHIMMTDEWPDRDTLSPTSRGGGTAMFMLYVPDVDRAFARAVAAGATVVQPVTDQFYGDRSGMIVDPFGHQWNIATHVEDVSEAELQRRLAAMGDESAAQRKRAGAVSPRRPRYGLDRRIRPCSSAPPCRGRHTGWSRPSP